MQKLLILFALLALSSISHAASVSGTACDLNLNILPSTIIEIRDPQTGHGQRFVSHDGTYSLDVPLGRYQLIATHADLAAVDTLIITDDSTIIHDLILIADASDLDELLAETEEQLVSEDDLFPITSPYWVGAATALALIAISAIAIHILRSRRADRIHHSAQKHPSHRDTPLLSDTLPSTTPASAIDETSASLKEDVLTFLTQEQGRTTQKAIRKQFPLSEAKISLVLSELEHDGKIKKIKKGRANIIIKND